MRMLLFSDLHLRPESEEVCFQVLDHVEQAAEAVDAIGFLGDFWHLRYTVPVYLLNRVAAWVQKVTEHKPLVFLPGNHDQIDVVGENALAIFEAHGAKVYSNPTIDKWGCWMPYRKDPVPMLENLRAFADLNSRKAADSVLFAHLPVKGALMNNLVADQDGLDVSAFQGFARVILGHYHKRQQWTVGQIADAVTYIGSPWQTRADEWNQPKGYAIWDPDKNVLLFVDTAWGRQYHRFDVNVGDSWDSVHACLSLAKPGDWVKVTVPGLDDVNAALASLKPGDGVRLLVEAREKPQQAPRCALPIGSPLTAYADQYVSDHCPPDLNAQTLRSMWQLILEGKVG